MKRSKKILAGVLLFAVFLGMVDSSAYAKTEEDSGQITSVAKSEKVVTITPFAGQWKYFGQARNFVQDTNYAASDDEPLPEGVSLKLKADTVGIQKFVVEDKRSEEEKQKISYVIDPKAPTFEIREYTTPEQVEPDHHVYNMEDKKEAEQAGSIVSGSAADASFALKKKIKAPKGYLISSHIDGDTVHWGSAMEVEIREGENVFTYFLRSNQNNASRKAIDQTPKTIVVRADWTAPEILSVTGENYSSDVTSDGRIISNEPGTFYYVVVPENHAELTKEDIDNNVGAHYGVVGFGRVDGTSKGTDFLCQGLKADQNYTIYAYMEDDGGNGSPVVKSNVFTTDRMALTGSVTISGNVAVDQVLTAKTNLDSVAAGTLSYQWYRIKKTEDASGFEEAWDETGGAKEDDLEAEEDEDSEDEDEDEDGVEIQAVSNFQDKEDDKVSLDGALRIPGAVRQTYQVTREDIGYRLICCVTSEKYSGYIAGMSTTFVPKLLPAYALPQIESINYSPKIKLASIALPKQWTWVDDSICPVYGNSGYRAKFVPDDTQHYKTIIVRIRIPVKKRSLTKSMIRVKKTRAYTGTAIKNNFSVKDKGKKLVVGRDIKVTYWSNREPGKVYMIFKGIGNYKGTVKVHFVIKKRSVKGLSYHYTKYKAYNGKIRTTDLAIKNGDVPLKKNRDYTVVFRNNKNIGTASIVVCGRGNYFGKKTLHYDIIPPKPAISEAKKVKRTLKLKFKGSRLIKGYYVYICPDKKFRNSNTTEYRLSGDRLQMNKRQKGTYYIRVKGYGINKEKIYLSSYSRIEKVIIKK